MDMRERRVGRVSPAGVWVAHGFSRGERELVRRSCPPPLKRWATLAGLMVLALTGCEPANEAHEKQVIVLGFDGLDPVLCDAMLAAGELPNLAKLAQRGSYTRLGTSTPPQSPVAWSNLITGTDSGHHGVFDFVHRDPETAVPFSSAATHDPPDPLPIVGNDWDSVSMFGYQFPFRATRMKTNRHARAFWEYLTESGVPAHVFRMPANYPPTESGGSHFCCLSDMGTVDLVNSQGTFSYYTEDPDERYMPLPAAGGKVHALFVNDHRAVGKFVGPVNDFKVTSEKRSRGGKSKYSEVPFVIHRDPSNSVVSISYGGQDVILNEGEWSDWYGVEFEMIPHALALKGICRFYLKEVHPHLKLYVSPFNFDPREESWEIDQPSDWSVRVSDKVGRYYTQGLPEDTKALSNKVLSRDEFLQQAELIYQERLKLLDFALDHYHGGLLFFYFGSSDQIGHTFWGVRDADHPAINDEERVKYKRVMEDVYVRLDAVVGQVAEQYPDATLMVMSDHGFGSYRRRFNMNTWLRDNGYAAMKSEYQPSAPFNFDFAETRVYALGINAMYVNVKGRETAGIVPPADKRALMDQVTEKLKAYRDPETGARVVRDVYQCDRIFSGPLVEVGPDMIVGYDTGYQGGGSLGEFPEKVIEDNTDAWCGDHCVAPELVPGVLFSSRRVGVIDPTLLDIAPTLMNAFGVAPPEQMKGRDLFATSLADGR